MFTADIHLRRLSVVILFLSLIQLSISCPSINQTLAYHERLKHAKRFYSQGNPQGGVEPWSINSWPVVRDGDVSITSDHPSGTLFQPIRFCWEIEEAYTNLWPHFSKAIEKWQTAIDISALAFVGDQGKDDTLCADARDDALFIVDTTDTTGQLESTIGYDYINFNSDRGRHYMHITRQEILDLDEGDISPSFVLKIAHELGHVLGLAHEHSRLDRENTVWFYCDNLVDYKRIANNNLPNRAPGKTMDQACSDYRLASFLGFSAYDFLPEPDIWATALGMRQWSMTYDWQSIMHYDSFAFSKFQNLEVPPFPRGAVLLRAKPGSSKDSKDGYRMYMGGNEDPEKAGISEGDRARVAQLYPKGDMAGQLIAAAPEWKPTSLGAPNNPVPARARRTEVPNV